MGAVVVRVIAAASVVLATGMTSALRGLGWCVVDAEHLAPEALTVLVLDDEPATRIPTPRSGARPLALAVDVCVGGVPSLPALIVHAERGAQVFNAATPFPVLVRLIDQALRDRGTVATTAADLRRRAVESAALARLTRQESAVLVALMSGASAADIAVRTHRSLHTVRSHIRSVLSKLGVTSQTAAVAIAARSGPPAELVWDHAHFTNSGDERR
ncbi:response regulator transcription factor [Cellulomonas taurus]|jgi:DNA-binding CsgD family transcriptional regulator|uniref:response regulator transcription factor n=1 Tax=Cellulomonas taurus TaxID=2729175 RepID=UPI00145DFAD9|nr:helix-turn-helix transcriptional regulator [Cellulomonas taurus]